MKRELKKDCERINSMPFSPNGWETKKPLRTAITTKAMMLAKKKIMNIYEQCKYDLGCYLEYSVSCIFLSGCVIMFAVVCVLRSLPVEQ